MVAGVGVQVPAHTAVFINEPRLSDFKLTLTKAGIHCEFGAGVLICNNVVAVRRVRARRMHARIRTNSRTDTHELTHGYARTHARTYARGLARTQAHTLSHTNILPPHTHTHTYTHSRTHKRACTRAHTLMQARTGV